MSKVKVTEGDPSWNSTKLFGEGEIAILVSGSGMWTRIEHVFFELIKLIKFLRVIVRLLSIEIQAGWDLLIDIGYLRDVQVQHPGIDHSYVFSYLSVHLYKQFTFTTCIRKSSWNPTIFSIRLFYFNQNWKVKASRTRNSPGLH